jgi:hypothetical protein
MTSLKNKANEASLKSYPNVEGFFLKCDLNKAFVSEYLANISSSCLA